MQLLASPFVVCFLHDNEFYFLVSLSIYLSIFLFTDVDARDRGICLDGGFWRKEKGG